MNSNTAAPKIVVVAHAPLAAALRAVALHVLGESMVLASGAAFIDVLPDASPAVTSAQITALLAHNPSGASEAFILTDLPHATPHNCAVSAMQTLPAPLLSCGVQSHCTAGMVLRCIANAAAPVPLGMQALIRKLQS